MAIEKTEVISVRFTPTEAQQVTQKAKKAGVAKSTYLRELAVGRISQDTADFSAYDHTEALNYSAAHALSLGLIGFAIVVLAVVYGRERQR